MSSLSLSRKQVLNAIDASNGVWLRAEQARVRQEINVATQKMTGLQNAINSRKTYLARLEAQLVLTSPAGQPAPAIAG